MKRIKLAWDECFARRNLTGTGVYAARLLEHLQNDPNIDVTVFGGWPNGRRGGNILHRSLKIAGNMAWTHLDLPLRLWKGRFDVLHAPAFIAPLKSPAPVVINVHDITYLLYPSHFTPWWVRYMRSVMPAVVRSAAAIICPSEHSKRDVVESYKVPASKVHVVFPGLDHQQFRPGARLDPDWVRQSGIREGYVLHVGELSHRKNIPMLLRAIAHLRSLGKWKDRQLVLAGAEAPGMLGGSEIRETIRQLELSSIVLLTGRVPDKHLPGLYSQASLLVMPSLYEGFGFPVVEAMAAGTPVIASNISSLPEVAGDAAILIPADDATILAAAIADVLDRASYAAELRCRGLVQARKFDWQHTATQTIAVYREITS